MLAVAGRPLLRAYPPDKAAETYATDPRPADYFAPADGADPADDDEITEILNAWRAPVPNGRPRTCRPR